MSGPRLEIVAVGDELAHGSQVDTNSAHIARTLEALGCVAARFHVVSDAPQDVEATFREVGARADLMLITGGLGPTEDDRTRHAAAAAVGADLVFDPASWTEIGAWFAARGRKVGDDNRRQALLPVGATRLTNDWGTAPGFAMRIGRALAFSLPGVPSEMRAMLEHRVIPRIRAEFAGRLRPTAHRLLVVLGPTEAALGVKIADLMAAENEVKVGITPHFGLLTIRVVAEGSDEAGAGCAADAVAAEVRRRVHGDLLYEGEGDPASRLLAAAARTGRTIATAESCTGGLVARMLTESPGSSQAFVGGYVTYANARKIADLGVSPEVLASHGAVSETVARAMAEGLAARTGASLALAVTGIAGPDGGTPDKPVGTVCFGLALDGASSTWTRQIPAVSREFVRTRAAFEILAVALRRTLVADAPA
ncbi:MAG: CinA family nicotinamide mononucleotide deamidase-related protein [Planctomycetota bacterium]